MRYSLITGILFTVLFTYPLFTYLGQPLGHLVYGRYGDILLDYFVFEHNLSKTTNLDFAHFLDTRMYYPLKNTWAFGNTYLPQSILSIPVFLVTKNAILSTNFAIIINFLLSYLAMYALAYYLTKNVGGAILAALVFTFNPYVWSHIHQLDLTALQWIPLIFLFTEKLIKKVSWPAILMLVLLLLIQLTSSFYYAFFILLLLPVYFLVRIYLTKVSLKQFFQIKILLGILIFAFLAFLYLKPFIEVKTIYKVTRDLSSVSLLSAHLSDFIFTTEDNRLYGWMVNLRDPFAKNEPTERSLFPGLTVYLLLGLSIYLFIRYKNLEWKKSLVIAYFILLISSLVLSFGPQLLIYLPIYHLAPFADSLRAVSRFVVISFLSASLIIAFAWSQYCGKLKGIKNLSLVLIITLIFLEYMHIAPKPYPISLEIKNFYSWLNNKQDVKVILELPMANWFKEQYPDISREPFGDYIYLLYGTLHKKQIINGAQALIPPEKIELGRSLALNFPTLAKLKQLRGMGADLIIVHKDQYNDPKIGEDIIQKLRRFDLQQVYKSDSISAFALSPSF